MVCVEVEEALVLSTWVRENCLNQLVEDMCWSVYESRFWH